jgi:hypothetical protein
MLDSTQKREATIEHLQSALGLTTELSEDLTGFLIERALDDVRGHRLVTTDKIRSYSSQI